MGNRINSRNKGSRNEREICKLLEKWTGYEFNRVPASGGLRWKKTDNITGDVICTDPMHRFPFSVEAKFHKDINFSHLLYDVNSQIMEFWKQAKDDGKRGFKLPLLFMRYNGLPKDFHFVAMSWSDYKYFKSTAGVDIKLKLVYRNSLVITNTEEFFNLNYKTLSEWATKRVNNIYGA